MVVIYIYNYMNNKTINMKDSVYQICNHAPEVVSILVSLGFQDIAKPGMLETMGRFMTLEKGANMKKISIESIRERLAKEGFEIIN